MTDLELEESQCGQPCEPNNPCEKCAPYWKRMIDEGYWDKNNHCWTDKSIRECLK